MVIKINPLDTLFFKDGKPFSMGEETWASGLFPPYPGVIYGAIRTAYFGMHPENLENLDQGNDPTKDLNIHSFHFLSHQKLDNGKSRSEIIFPAPLDLVKEKKTATHEEAEQEAFPLSLTVNEKNSNAGTPYILSHQTDKEIEGVEGKYLTLADFNRYLNNSNGLKISGISVYSESKVGIGRDRFTHTSAEGQLYFVEMKRPVGWELIVGFENLELSHQGFIKLGAEGKAADYTIYKEEIAVNLPVIEKNRFKWILATPSVFENGWIPGWINKNTLEGEYCGLKLRLLTAAIGKPAFLGGFDIKNRRPKPMRKSVPAGSVYYFELLNGDAAKVSEVFHGKCISDYELSKQGFGLGFIGKVNS